MLNKLTANLMVEDVDRTVAFYREVLGFAPLATAPETAPYDWALLHRDAVEIMFQKRASLGAEIPALAEVPIGASLDLYVEVTDIQELYAALKGRVEIVADLHTTSYGAQEFYFRDCDGYILGFAQQPAPAETPA